METKFNLGDIVWELSGYERRNPVEHTIKKIRVEEDGVFYNDIKEEDLFLSKKEALEKAISIIREDANYKISMVEAELNGKAK